MPGAGNKLQCTTGTLCAPPHAGHGRYPGLVDTLPPALTQVWHVRHIDGAQWKAPCHGNVHQGGEAEAEDTARGRGAEEHGGALSGLQKTFGGSGRVLIPWEGSDIFG